MPRVLPVPGGRSPLRLASYALLTILTAIASSQGVPAPRDPAQAVPPSRQADNVAIITIATGDGMIDSVTAQSFARRLEIAERSGANAFVVELDTPGGEIGAVLDICDRIKSSTIENSAAWINQRAYSGGAIIALACGEIITNSPASLGDALPIAADPLRGLLTLPPEERGKLMIPLIREVIDSARRRNREAYTYDEYLVQGIITGVELWWIEHIQTGQRIAINRSEYRALFGSEPIDSPPRLGSATPGLSPPIDSAPLPVPPGMGGTQSATPIQAASPRLEGVVAAAGESQDLASLRPTLTPADAGRWRLIERISDGSAPLVFRDDDLRRYNFASNATPIRTDEDVRAWFGAKEVRRLDPLWSEGLVRFMTSLPVRGILLVLFLLGMFIEMVHPGLIVPSLVALTALAGLLIPPFLIGMANWWEVAAIIAGILLVISEIFIFPGFGVPGVLGVIALFAGLLGTFIPDQGQGLFPDTREQQQDLLFGALTLVLATTTAIGAMWFVSRRFGTLPLFKHLVLKDDDESDELLRAMDPVDPGIILMGDLGRALTDLRPIGRVEIGGRSIDAVAESGYIDAGRRVRVVEVTAFRTVVAEEASESA